MSNLAFNLIETVGRYPDRVALRLDESEVSYRSLDADSARLAGLLVARGLRPGDRVGVMLPNVPHFAVAYYAVLRAGGVVVPMNVLLKDRETSFYLSDSEAKAIIAWHEFAPAAQAGADAAGADCIVVVPGEFEELISAVEPLDEPAARDDNETAVILYTSGTTGKPKGAELTHANLRRNVEVIVEMLQLSTDDVILGALPLFHAFGQTAGLNAAVAVGACLTLIPRFSPAKALQIIERDRVTVFEGVPTMFAAMLHHEGRPDTGSLRFCVSGGAAMPVEVMRGFEDAFSAVVLEGYGLSETSPAASFNHPDRERKPGSIGTPVAGVEMKLLEPSDGVGEIAIRGHNIMKGYWNRPEATATAIDSEGWFRTGDLARVDEDGYYFIVDRAKDMIIRGGYNVYPREIEEVLYEHPAVREAAVVGVPHDMLGEEVGAAIALVDDAEADATAISDFVKERVAGYKYPRRIWFVDELPKGPTGKILKRDIAIPVPADQSVAAASEPETQRTTERAAPREDGRAPIAVENPATGKVIGHVPDMTADEVAELARRGRAAQPGWEALGFEGRKRVLKRMQRWLVDNADRVIGTICSETGKAYEDAQIAELIYGAAAFGFWADKSPIYLADERVKSSSVFVKGKRLILRYRPLGLIGVIGPWNYPLTNSFGDCIPALAAGNSVILKPSEITPLTSVLLAEGLAACGLPKDVFAVATGLGATGAALIDEVDMIMFTGSTATGRKVAVRAAERLIPASLELGGKDPMIVLKDADIERAANHAAYYSMFNSGQTCISIERCYVEAPVYDEFVARVTEKVRALRQGVPAGPGSIDVGSLTFPPQVDIVERHVEESRARGAKVLTGGHRGRSTGYWFEPTVLVDVDHDMACMREETFGPTLPIMKVADAEEAIRLANDSEYGLCAAVFSGDSARGEAIARRVNAGAVTINDALVNYTALELPMGGARPGSGIGYRHGAGGIRKYCRQQSLLISRVNPHRDPHMYPYKAGRTRLIARLVALIYRGRR